MPACPPVCLSESLRACVRAYVRACVRTCVCAYVRVYVHVVCLPFVSTSACLSVCLAYWGWREGGGADADTPNSEERGEETRI